METCVILKQLKIKQEWVKMKSRNLANVSQIWALLSPPNVKAVNKVGFAAQWELLGNDGLGKQMSQEGAATHHILRVCNQRSMCRGKDSPPWTTT